MALYRSTRTRRVQESHSKSRIKRSKDVVLRPQSVRDKEVIVGTLKGVINGRRVRMVVTLDDDVTVGRGSNCTLKLRAHPVSRRHLRFYSVRTDTNLTLTVVHDNSSNGIILNDKLTGPGKGTERAYILRDGDIVGLPGTDITFTYSHKNDLHGPVDPDTLQAPSNRNRGHFHPFTDSAQYKIGRWVCHNYLLGKGSFGYLFLGENQSSGSQVACKLIPNPGVSQPLQDPCVFGRIGEVEALKRICHPNIINFLDEIADPEHERQFVIMPLMKGGDLFSYLHRYAGLSELEVKFMACQLVKGIRYLHDRDMAHRDLKPENIMLSISCAFPRLVISDLGDASDYRSILSRVPTAPGMVTRTEVIGTTVYCPPERLKGERCYNYTGTPLSDRILSMRVPSDGSDARRADIARTWLERDFAMDAWALGCMLWYAATGHHPYQHLHKQDSMQYGPNTTTHHRGTSETLYLKDKPEDMSDHGKIGQGKRYGSPKFSDIQLEAEPIKPSPFNIPMPTLNLEITDGFERQSSPIDQDEDEAEAEEGDDEPNSERDVSDDVAQSSYPIDRNQWDDIHRARRSIELFQEIDLPDWPCWDSDTSTECSNEARQFILSLLTDDPAKRLHVMKKGLGSKWITSSKGELTEIHETVVNRGEMFIPQKAQSMGHMKRKRR